MWEPQIRPRTLSFYTRGNWGPSKWSSVTWLPVHGSSLETTVGLPAQQTLTPKHGLQTSRAATWAGLQRSRPHRPTGPGHPRAGASRWGGRTCHRTGRGSAACRGGDRLLPHPPRRPRHRCLTVLAGRPPPQRPGRLAHANGQLCLGPQCQEGGREAAKRERSGPGGPSPPPPPPSLRAPPPRLRVPGAGGGEGLSPAPRGRGLGAEGPGYPPSAPNVNEHMAAVPLEPGAPGGGDQAGQRRRNCLRALPAREPGNERECEREGERGHAVGPKLREPCGAWKQERVRAGSRALPASGPRRCSCELGWAGREPGLRLLPQGWCSARRVSAETWAGRCRLGPGFCFLLGMRQTLAGGPKPRPRAQRWKRFCSRHRAPCASLIRGMSG